jgi:NAD(P) transhydrogenase subunit alpha
MKIAIPKERREHERRVAATPDTAKRLVGQGNDVVVEPGAGVAASYPDALYEAAGARVAADAVEGADIVLKVQRPLPEELPRLKRGAVLVAMVQALQNRDDAKSYAEAGLSAFDMTLIPRITRAQSMDVLSSQANLAGYKAVLDAASLFGRAFPMMMTAAGTVPPARVLVMGAGVAGLQAIATARRLGAVVSATDVRAAAKEQVESLGGSFLVVDLEAMKAAETSGGYAKEMGEDFQRRQREFVGEALKKTDIVICTSGGYAKEMGEDFQRRQREFVGEALKKTDIVICTALIPGRKAPILLTREMVANMRPGSVIVDLAVEQGGNVEGSRFAETVTSENGVQIVGHANYPSRIAVDSSALYARNILAFLGLILTKEGLKIDTADEIVKGTLLAHEGKVVHPSLVETTGAA